MQGGGREEERKEGLKSGQRMDVEEEGRRRAMRKRK